NDMILSTAIGCLDDDENLKSFIGERKAEEASVLIVSFKDSSYSVSSDVLKYADDIGLPMFSIPWEIHFSDIVNFVTIKIHDKNIESYKKIQDELFNAYFTSKPLDEAVKIISLFFGSPVSITNKSDDIKGKYPADFVHDSCVTFEIRMNKFLWGYIHVFEPENCEDLLRERDNIEKYISTPLSLWFNKESIEDMMIMRLKNDFVWNLANKNYSSFDEMARQGIKLGFDLYNPYMCAIFNVSDDKAKNFIEEYSSETAAITSEIETIIVDERTKLGTRVMFADRGLLFVIYIEAAGSSISKAENFINSLDKHLTERFPNYNFHWGISEIQQDSPVDFSRLYENAYLALQYCLNSKDNRYMFTYKDTKIHQIISALTSEAEIKKTAEEALAGLMENDKNSSMDLFSTLTEYIKNNYNTSLTARCLHLNRQSLLYRLEKIEALTGMSLSNHKDLFLLEVFTRIFADY
ncbi:MAG: helix-turn-helix domain-containing protein, partial [Clostridiales bacterium]|nr:helix-turn-helix domain-containing protein [Clostridiales bacterium]